MNLPLPNLDPLRLALCVMGIVALVWVVRAL